MDGLAGGLDYVFAAICGFTAMILLSQQHARQDHMRTMAAFLVLSGIDTVDDIFVRSGLYESLPSATHWGMLALLPLPFVVYLYTLAVSSPEPVRLRSLSPWHAIAILALAVPLLPYLTLDGDIKLALALDQDHPAFETVPFFLTIVLVAWVAHPGFIALLLVYLVLSLRLVARHNRRVYDLFSNVDDKTLRWLRTMLLILAAFWLYDAADFIVTMVFDYPDQPEAIENLVTTLMLIAFCYFGLRQGAIFDLLDADAAIPGGDSDGDGTDERWALDRDHAARLAGRLERAMTRDRCYRDPMLTLRQLSERTRISEHHISEVLNRHLGSSFYDFINRWRIEEAMQLLADDPDRTALAIAMDVGFNSKSTFYAAFKKQNGQSPIAYRKAALETGAARTRTADAMAA